MMAGPGKGRARPAKGRVEEMKAESSPARRTTRQQQQQDQDSIPEELDNIDPSLTDQESGLPENRPKIAQRGTRRDPERHESLGPSLTGQPSSSPNLPSSANGNIQLEMADPVPPPSTMPAPRLSVMSNGAPSWKKERIPGTLPRLRDASLELFTHLKTYTQLSEAQEAELDDWNEQTDYLRTALDAYRNFLLERRGAPVILPNYVLDLMETTPSSHEGFQASRIIYATNCATLLQEILTVSKETALPFLERWDEWFPQVFFEGEHDSKDYVADILVLVRDIRTQRLIFTLRGTDLESDDLAAIKLVKTIFCDEDTDLENLTRDLEPTATDIGIKRIPFISIEEQEKLSFTHRVRGIVSALESPDSLDEEWNFDTFRTAFCRFVEKRFEDLYKQDLGQYDSHPSGSMKRPAPDSSTAVMTPRKRRRAKAPRVATQPPETSFVDPDTGALVTHPQYSVGPLSEDAADLEAISQLAKVRSAAIRKPREPQVRSPWVQPDVRTLIHAVDTYKCRWSEIARAIKSGELPFERPRDQQALRDKARLLKQDFLKTDSELPPSFDLVVLGKKEKAAIIACGKNPDRKEDDKRRNADGSWTLVNTNYVEEAEEMEEE